MNKMHISKFCGIPEEGKKADTISRVFEMLDKGLSGEYDMDRSLTIHNHVSIGTKWMMANVIVDLGIANHRNLAEAYECVMTGTEAVPIGTATIDNKKGGQIKTCSPSLESMNRPGASYCFTLATAGAKKSFAESYKFECYNPHKENRLEGILNLTLEQLLDLNPNWIVEPECGKYVRLGVDGKTGEILTRGKYFKYFEKNEEN